MKGFQKKFTQENFGLIFSSIRIDRGKRVVAATMAPLLSRSVDRPRGHRAKKSNGVHYLLWKTTDKDFHCRSGTKVTKTLVVSEPDKEKGGEGFYGSGAYFFPD